MLDMNIWQVEDACFNYTINSLSGLKRLEDVVENLRNIDDTSVCFIQGNEIETFCISFISEKNWGSYYPILAKIAEHDEKYLYKIDRTAKWYKDFDIMKALFVADGYSANWANYLFYLETVVRFYSFDDLFRIRKIYNDIDEIYNILGKL